jgi:hypothetical protein
VEKRTIEQITAVIDAFRRDVSGRAEELAEKSTAGTLTEEESKELARIVQMNELLSLLRIEAEDWPLRAAS